MKKWENKIIKVAENCGWKVKKCNDEYWLFSIYSPQGQDCSIESSARTLEELIETLRNFCDSFDVSEETYLWLDNFGHGKNGAPYDMKDVYEDMEWYLNAAEVLRNEIEKLV